MKKLYPSLMCMPPVKTAEALAVFAQTGIEALHIDVMDGHFVPNFSIGTDYCRMLRRETDIPFDYHLMIERPEEKLGWFDIRPGDAVSVHAEATPHLQRALAAVRACGAKPMAALNPATPLTVLDYVIDDLDGVLIMTVNPGYAGQKLIPAALAKITACRAYLNAHGRADAGICVDGNVSFANAPHMSHAGADCFVCGTSSIFSSEGTLAENIARMRACVE